MAETVLAREHAAGRIGDHVETEDVLLAITMLADVLARTDVEERRAVAPPGLGDLPRRVRAALTRRAARPYAARRRAASSTDPADAAASVTAGSVPPRPPAREP